MPRYFFAKYLGQAHKLKVKSLCCFYRVVLSYSVIELTLSRVLVLKLVNLRGPISRLA
jgi:hypothetical protein